MRAVSIANIEEKRFDTLPFSPEFEDAFGQRERGGIWMVYGKSGQGKTRFVLDLAKEFDRQGLKVMMATLEMGFCKDFKAELHEAGIRSKIHHITFCESLTIDELSDALAKQRSPDVVIIDSIQYFVNQYDATAEQMIELRKKYKKKIFVYVSHVDGKEVDGKAAYMVKRDSFVRILVEGFRAIYIGRGKAGPIGYYTIWKEKADLYWVKNNGNENNEFTSYDSAEAGDTPPAKTA